VKEKTVEEQCSLKMKVGLCWFAGLAKQCYRIIMKDRHKNMNLYRQTQQSIIVYVSQNTRKKIKTVKEPIVKIQKMTTMKNFNLVQIKKRETLIKIQSSLQLRLVSS